MVKHIILWKLREDLSEDEVKTVKLNIKQGLEGLRGQIPGLTEIRVQIDNIIESSNADILLDCTLASQQALRAYAVHPLHMAVANSKVRPYTAVRTCIDFEL